MAIWWGGGSRSWDLGRQACLPRMVRPMRAELALASERELGLAHGEDVAPKARGVYLSVCPAGGNRLATMTASMTTCFQAVDLRLQSHRWMNDLEAAGGRGIRGSPHEPRTSRSPIRRR